MAVVPLLALQLVDGVIPVASRDQASTAAEEYEPEDRDVEAAGREQLEGPRVIRP
jgi:hypothetical protein